jgi:hypothetical protein
LISPGVLGARRLDPGHHLGHQRAHVALAFHAHHHALHDAGHFAAWCIAGFGRLWH